MDRHMGSFGRDQAVPGQINGAKSALVIFLMKRLLHL